MGATWRTRSSTFFMPWLPPTISLQSRSDSISCCRYIFSAFSLAFICSTSSYNWAFLTAMAAWRARVPRRSNSSSRMMRRPNMASTPTSSSLKIIGWPANEHKPCSWSHTLLEIRSSFRASFVQIALPLCAICPKLQRSDRNPAMFPIEMRGQPGTRPEVETA